MEKVGKSCAISTTLVDTNGLNVLLGQSCQQRIYNMELALKTRILAGLAFAQVEAHEASKRFGYWEKERNMSDVFALIHRDTAKALEVITVGDGPSDKLKDVTRGEEKLADIFIRILDVAAGMNLHVAPAVIAKLEYNESLSKAMRKDY